MATEYSRRAALSLLSKAVGGAAALSAWPTLAAKALSHPTHQAQPLLLGAAASLQDKQRYLLAATSLEGELRYQLALPSRGHDTAVHPQQNLAACVARRPGHWLYLLEASSGKLLEELAPPTELHFCGHATFADDALYVSVVRSADSRGYVLVYRQEQGWWQLAERFHLNGLGPHQLVVLDEQRLAVALGGIHTQARKKLNLDSMQPALLILDRHSGKLLEQQALADKQLSIRHLAYDAARDTLWLACQGQDPSAEPQALIYSYQAEQGLQALEADADYWAWFNHYVGSIAVSGDNLLASSPRGHCLAQWSLQQRSLDKLLQVDDVCGLAANAKHWWASTGQGRTLQQHGPNTAQQLRWDNHLSLYTA